MPMRKLGRVNLIFLLSEWLASEVFRFRREVGLEWDMLVGKYVAAQILYSIACWAREGGLEALFKE